VALYHPLSAAVGLCLPNQPKRESSPGGGHANPNPNRRRPQTAATVGTKNPTRRASAGLSSSFTSEDDRYVDDGDRRQGQQHDYEADRRIDQVQPDREGCTNDQTKHGKP